MLNLINILCTTQENRSFHVIKQQQDNIVARLVITTYSKLTAYAEIFFRNEGRWPTTTIAPKGVLDALLVKEVGA